jgi:hypothetical protein
VICANAHLDVSSRTFVHKLEVYDLNTRGGYRLAEPSRALAQGCELTPAECVAAEAYAAAVVRESGSAGAVRSTGR